EVQRLVGEFGASGLSRGEFCRIHGMTLSTLQRGLRRERTKPGDIQSDGKKLVRVKVIGGSGTADREGPCGMAGVLTRGRRIELSRYDARPFHGSRWHDAWPLLCDGGPHVHGA